MYDRLECNSSNTMGYRITRPLSREEVHRIAAEVEGEIDQSGQVNLLIDLQAFPYQDLAAFWEDLKFDIQYAGKIKKLALVGGTNLEAWATRIFTMLSRTESRCFAEKEVEAACDWLAQD